MEEIEKFLISILIVNVKGQLGKIASFCGDNNLNILRLVLAAADRDDKIQRIIAYVEGKREDAEIVCEKLKNFDENTLKVTNFLTKDQYIEKELALIKVTMTNPSANKVMNLINTKDGKIIFSNQSIMVFKIEETEDNMNEIVNNLTDITKDIEVSRSGMVVMALNDHIDDIMISNL